MANVKFFADRQTDGQAKIYTPPIFQYRDIKRTSILTVNIMIIGTGIITFRQAKLIRTSVQRTGI
jgi:hypothetical protein